VLRSSATGHPFATSVLLTWSAGLPRPARKDHAPSTETHPRTATRNYRPELQGLRGLAVGLVSGFLLTGQLVRAAERGPLGLSRRWSRTLLRIGPAALTVLVSVAVAGAVLLPEGRWAQTIRELLRARA
jgi:peptidoglycan/LPS O-acetylase OafA/YrhL